MPRTTEHIVACHEHATALRRAGKPIWAHKVNLQAILDKSDGQTTPEQVAEIGHKLAKELRRLPAKYFNISSDDCDFEFLDVVEELEQMTAKSLIADCKNSEDGPADVLDNRLEEIYDWCDRNRVWTRG